MDTEMSQDAGFVVSGRNYGLVPMQGQATDAETQLARLEDFMNAGYDAEAAKRARVYYGEGVPIEHISEEDKSFFAGAAFARIKGVPNNPEAYWHAQKKDIPDVEREQMFELLGAELRQQVRSRWDERQARIKAVQNSLGRMDAYVRGDEFGETFSEQDLANVRGVMDAETMADAEAVRAWMRTYMQPLATKDDAEEILRTVDALEYEFYEVIRDNPRRAELAYDAMMHWAEGMKQSGKVGVTDEFVVGVGKKLSNWGKAVHLMAPAVAMAPVGHPDFPIMLSDSAMAGQQAELAYRHQEYVWHDNARSILRAAINKSLELGDNVSWWKGAARTASQMAGDSSAYLLPGVGMYTGTADLLVGGATETTDRFALQGLSGSEAAGQAAIETGVQALVELTPWGRVGGKGLSSFTRRYFGDAIEKGTAGKLSRWVVRNTQNSTMRALLAEGAASFVDEGILEPIAGGLMTYGAEQAADVLGIPHGQSREFTECFDELKALYTDPYQAAGLFLFTAGLTGAGAYGVRENVRHFAKHRKMWEAAGLTPEQVDRVMAADDRVELGGKLVREGWESDPAGMRERVLKANKDIAERGEVLVLTGEGALDAELENSELAPAYRAVWQEYQDKGLLPKVEAVGNNQFRITKEGVDITLDARGADAYLQHAIDEVDSIQTRELQQRLGKEHFIDLRAELADAVSTIAGNAAMRAAEAAGERTGVAVTDITKGLPEWLADGIVKRGQVTLKDAQDITEWAIGRIDGLVQEGMSPADARLTRASAEGMARTLGDWSTFARDFARREQLAGLEAGEGAITISRTRNEQAVSFDGRQVLGQTIMTLPGNVRHQGAVEDVTESFADMMVQQRAQVILEGGLKSAASREELTIVSGNMSYKDAQEQLAKVAEDIRNDETGITVPINTTQRNKLTSPKARRKSIANGFTGSQHNAVAAKIGAVFKHALLLGAYNDRNNDPNIESMKRFATPIMVDGERAMAFLTVKSTFQKKGVRGEKARNEVISRLYSVELDEIVKLDGQLKRLDHLRQNASASSSEEIISRFEEKVKSVFSEKSAMNEAEAEAQAWQELGELVQRARAAVLKADPQAEIEEVKPGDRMSIIEALSTMATSKFVASGAVPQWMQGLTAALKGNLAAADSLAKVRAAYASVLQNDPSAVSELDAMLDKLGVYVQDTFREARVEAVDIQAWKHAHALVTARAESPAGSGGAPVSEAVQEAERMEQAIRMNDERVSGTEVPRSDTPQEEVREAQEILDGMVPGSNAPAEMQGVFVDDKCYYNAAGGFWCGMIDKHKLRDGTEQVKVGAKGKHGVIAGRELTGKFQQNVGAIYIWKRTNGELQVISGRHRFAKLMEDDSAQSCNAYVFEEDAEHDERWARMLDYENNMRDDQADEVTAATYVRETGLSDAELEVRGLMRNGTRCKRGALIGRHAREELWTRFSNGAVKPMDAEIICNLTRSIRDQGRVEEIQRRCCMLLDEKKSWEYIGAMVQLMANKENVVMKQGLLDFGADFEADLARAAEWIERNIKAINESVTLLKQGRKLSGKKRAEAERLGISTATQEGTEQMLYDLEQLHAQFEMIGSYPDLVAAAQMWDGKTQVDPVGQYLERARAEREQVRAEGEMTTDEYLEEQARKEAAESVPSLFSMSMQRATPEMEDIKAAAEKSGSFMKAPNGKPTNLTEHQWLQVRTKAFKQWFGDWENDPANASKVVDENGEPLVVYHGARHAGFRVFDNEQGVRQSAAPDGTSFFSSSRDVAYSYAGSYDEPDLHDEEMQEEIEDYGIEQMDSGIYEVFLNIRDPHTIDFKGRNWQPEEYFYSLVDENGDYIYPLNGEDYYNTEYEAIERAEALGLKDYEVYQEYKDTNSVAQEGMDMGADGVIIENVIDEGSYGYGDVATDYIVFSPNQIKSATQNRGSFAPGNPDITFSMERNLAAVHSLSEEKFLAAVELGGMPMPSVAVTRLDRPYEWGGAGAINLIGKPEMVDPRKKSKVYMHDAYTGTMPPVMYRKKNTEGAQKLKEDVLEKLAPYGMDASDGLKSGIFSNDYNESVVDGYYADWGNNRALMAYWAITQAGYAPKPKMKEAEGRLSPELYKALKPWVDTLPKGRMFSDDYTEDMLEGFRAAMVGYFEGKGKKVLAVNYRGLDYRTLQLQAMDFAGMVRKHTTKKLPDAVENGKRFVAYAEKRHKAFKAWADTERKKYLGEKVFSRKYVRRNWRGEVVDEWWGHEKYTLSNLMKYMREEKGRGEESASMSPGLFLAVLSEEFRSLREMQSKRDRIVDSYAHQDAREEWQKSWDKFFKLAYGLKKPGWGSYFEIADAALWRLLELVQGTRNMPSREAVERKLNESKDEWTDEHVDAAMELLSKAIAMPSDYMEAIPQRAVKMDEWEYAVLPVGLKKNKAVMAALRENGIKPVWHDGTEEGRRAALAGLVDDSKVSFSVIGPKAKTWDKYKDRAFTGRDDGMMRAEIDASRAKLKWEDLRGKNVAAYRRIVAGWDTLPEAERKQVETFAEQVYDWQDESQKLNSTPENEFLEQYNKVIKLRDTLKPKRAEIRSLLSKIFVEHGGGAAVVLNMKDAELDELALSFWGPYVESKVEDMLDLRPLWHGGMKLADVLEYPELYEAYPELADITVRYATMDTARGRALYHDGEHEILINRNLEGEWRSIHSILLHEIQHHIQNIEGFAKGGNLSSARRMVNNRAAMGDADALALREHSDMELYERIAGEIEARNVQARYGWSMDRREAIPFNSTLEYPGEALVTFSVQGDVSYSTVHVPLYHEILDTFEQRLSKDNKAVWVSRTSGNNMFTICPYPDVLNAITPWMRDVIAGKDVIKKLMNKHHLLPQDVAKLPHALWNPIAVFEDPKAKQGGFIVVSDILASNNEGVMKHVMVVLELKADNHNAVITDVKSAYSADKTDKYAALLSKGYLRYADKERALLWAGAEGDSILQLLTTALSHSGSRVMLKENVPGVNTIFTASMEKASLRALDLLTIRADERAGEQLIKDWQAACENWGRFSREDAGRLGNGAKMLGEMQALIGATKGVLPERYCRMGHLNGLMRWASIYAKMQQDGTLPQVGEIKGPIYQKFLEKLQQADELNRLQGMSEQEAQEAMALLAGERLDTAMLKVARECRRRLEQFLKDRELERIDRIVEKAYPKRQSGQKWPRGKMAADAYRRMERAREYMNLPADKVAERINDAKRKLDALDATDADFERKEEELEEEISLLQTFGCWENMGFEQARRACGVMTEMVLLGRARWKEKLQAERRRANYDRARISRNFRTKLADVQRTRAKTDAKEKARKRTIGKKLAMGTMSYSQLMLALEPQLGKEFTGRHMRMIAKAHERLQTGTQQLHRRMFSTLSEITGLKTEGEMEEWLKSNNEIIDTGIVLKPRITETCRMTPEEVEEWLALSKAQRDARRKQAEEEAGAKGELPDNVPSEDALEKMREKLEASRKAGTSPKEYVVTIEKRYESPLHCTKEAMLFAILTFEQDDYTRLMDVNGVNEKALQRMRELVGDKLLRWGYAMREMLNEQGMTMAAIYEAHTGVPFAKRANYFRGVFDIAKAKDKGESIDSATSITGGKYGCLIPRQYHHQMLNWGTSATQVFIGTYKEQQNYICTSHITREWRTLLSNQGFEKRLRAEIGDAALDMIHGWCKMIDGSVIADAKVNAMMNRMLGRVMGAYAVSRLAGNVYTIIKQVSAVLNGFVGGYVPEQVLAGDAVAQQLTYRHIGFGEYAAALARAMSGQTEISAEEIANAGFIAGRKRVEGSHLEEAAMLAPGQSVPGKVGRAGREVYEANMDAIGYVDRKCNTLAALAVADAVYRAAKRENKDNLVPDAELRRVAIETAGMVIDRAAQPQLRTQKGYWAAGGGAFGAMGNFFYMFKSEVLGKLGLYVGQMFAGHHGAWLGGALSFGVLNSLVLALIDYVRGYWYDDEEDKWEKRAKQFAWNILANDISAVPVLGDLEGWARSTVLGGRQWNSSLVDMVVPFKDMYSYGKREVKNIAEDESWDKHVQALCGFARALGAAGGWWQGNSRVAVGSCAELTLAAAAISNIVRFGKDAVKKVGGEEE